MCHHLSSYHGHFQFYSLGNCHLYARIYRKRIAVDLPFFCTAIFGIFSFEEVALFSQHLNESEIDETIFMDGTSKVTANQKNETKREKEMKLKSATIANRNPSIFVVFEIGKFT